MRLRTVTDWEGQTTGYTYTAAGRLAAVQLPKGILGHRRSKPPAPA